MNNIGKTPLLRARNIERRLGVSKIYIKLEGNNPSKSIYDRYAKNVINYLKTSDNFKVLIDGNKNILKSLLSIAQEQNIQIIVPVYKNQRFKKQILKADNILDLVSLTKNQANQKINEYIAGNDVLNLLDNDVSHELYDLAQLEVIKEITDRVTDIQEVYLIDDDKIRVKAYTRHFLQRQIVEKTLMPKIFSTKANELKKDIDNELFDEAYDLLRKEEFLKVKKGDIYVFSKFLKSIKEEKKQNGVYVVILDTARTYTNIKQITDYQDIQKVELIKYVDNYLGRYSDPIWEVEDAIDNAIEKGFILLAKKEEEVEGILVVVNTGFDNFIPTYHLAYIGINPLTKGRGLGSELIKSAINLANGKISLHVDLDNRNAKKLYRKLGFRHVYDRMIYNIDN